MRYYVTSDVHGFYTPLREILTRGIVNCIIVEDEEI